MNGDSADGGALPARVEPHQIGLGRIFHRTRDAIVLAEASAGRIVLWNEAAVEMFGYTIDEAVGLLVEDLVPSHLKAQHREGLARFAHSGGGALIESGTPIELPAVRKDGSRFWIELSLTPAEVGGATSRYVLAIVRDITRRRDAEARLRHANTVLERTEALAKVGSWEWDLSNGLSSPMQWSNEMCRIHGIRAWTADVTVDRVRGLLHEDDVAGWAAALTSAAMSRQDMPGLAYRVAHGGELRWVWTEACFFSDRPDVLVGFAQDVTEQKEITDELARLALFDELTGVRNRRGFMTAAEPLVRVAQRDQQDLVLLYLDVDNLKAINDRFGHDAGDRALANVARLLLDTFRASDLVARLGGDEFCVLLRATDADQAARRLHQAHAASDMSPRVAFSVGAARQSAGDPAPVEELIRRADAAMYVTKAAKKGR